MIIIPHRLSEKLVTENYASLAKLRVVNKQSNNTKELSGLGVKFLFGGESYFNFLT